MDINNVLFVSYEFPPEGCRGTKRVMKFVNYLRPLAYNPIILTVKNGNYEYHDGSLLAELPTGLKIFRSYTLENLFYRTNYDENEVRDARAEKSKKLHLSSPKRFLLLLYHLAGQVIRIPDSRILWLPFALIKGLQIIKRNKIKLIFASGPSFTNHLIGTLLKKITHKPLILDYRDAWVSDPARKLKYKWQKNIVKQLEQFAILNANKVVSTTDGITTDFINRYGQLNGKFVTITHGYDPADFKDLITNNRDNVERPFRIVHSGTLGHERSPKEFLEAIGDLIKEEPDLQKNIELIFVGQNTLFRDGKTIEEYIRRYKLQDIVKLTGFVSRKESLQYIVDANLLLLIIGTVPSKEAHIYGISAKIYDYAFAKKPVMTISEEGASTSMARHLGLGCVVNPSERKETKKWIKRYYRDFKDGNLQAHFDVSTTHAFDYRNLSKKLANYFDTITSQ
jgi:glycosyltransferase involved in cell wall biosynthesis